MDKLVNNLDELLEQIAKDSTTSVMAKGILENLKKNLMDKDYSDNRETILKILKSGPIKKYINFLVRTQLNGESLTDYDFQGLKLLIYILQTVYNYDPDGGSPITDYTYDRLYELLEDYNEEMITTPLIGRDRIASHTYKSLRGTLKKVYALDPDEKDGTRGRRSLDDWISECERLYKSETGNTINLNNEEVYVFPKWDGVSVVFEFDENNKLKRALTRGNVETNEAIDVTFIFSTMQGDIRDESMSGRAYGLKTEAMVSEKDKASYNEKYGTNYHSARSIASSIINSGSKDGRENLLEVVRLRTSVIDEEGNEMLQELAENVYERPYLRCQLSQRDAIRKFANKNRNIRGLLTDGVVIYIIDENIRKVLGRKDNKNQYEIAYKYAEEIGYTKLEDVAFNVTTFGRIFPVAKLKKIQLKGNDVSSVSLGSIAIMRDMKLRRGDTVRIQYDISPALFMDDDDPKCIRTKNPIIPCPTVCPECGDALQYNTNDTILTCINPVCPARMRGRILNYVNKVGIRNVGDSTVKSLMDAKLVKWIPDIYRLKDHIDEMIALQGFDTVSVNNIIAEIESHRSLSAVTLLSAVGIESLGKKTAEKLISKYTIDELMEFAENGKVSVLVAIPDIKDKLAKQILDGIWENEMLLKSLLGELTEVTYEVHEEAKFIVVFHNIRSRKLTMDIESMGGLVEDNLTKRTTFLIVPNGFSREESATLSRARRYNIPIVEIDDVPEYLERFK